MKMKFNIATFVVVIGFLAWLFVPPPPSARAQFAGQSTYAGISGGSANAQTITIRNLSALLPGVPLTFKAGFSNTGSMTLSVNSLTPLTVFRPTSVGYQQLSGQEISLGEQVTVGFDPAGFLILLGTTPTIIGQTIELRGATAPRGTLIEDGTCISQAAYPALFTVIGTGYGSCGAGLFALPDSRGTLFAASDNQGLNGNAGRITSAGSGCTATSIPFTCGAQNKTVTTSFLPASGLSVPGLNVPAQSVAGLSIPSLSIPGLSIPGLSIPGLTVPSLTVNTTTNNVGIIPLSSGAVSSLQTSGSATTNITPANTSGTWSGTTSLSGTGTTVASTTVASTTGTGTTGGGGTGVGTTGTGTTSGGTTGGGTTGAMGSGTAMPILNPILGGLRAIRY